MTTVNHKSNNTRQMRPRANAMLLPHFKDDGVYKNTKSRRSSILPNEFVPIIRTELELELKMKAKARRTKIITLNTNKMKK